MNTPPLYLGAVPDANGGVALAVMGEAGFPVFLDDIPLREGRLDVVVLREKLRILQRGFIFRRALVARPAWGAPTVAALQAALDLLEVAHALADLPHERTPTPELIRLAVATAPRAAAQLQGPTQRAKALALLLAHKARCAA